MKVVFTEDEKKKISSWLEEERKEYLKKAVWQFKWGDELTIELLEELK